MSQRYLWGSLSSWRIDVGSTNNNDESLSQDYDLYSQSSDNMHNIYSSSTLENYVPIRNTTMGGFRFDYIYDSAHKDNYIYSVGASNSYSGSGDYDVFISKLDLEGNIVWNKT
ncbi:MAG: hypothetical protein ACTSU2_10330 [Promethearchaeota archaeon]